jgi:hypothetical protein
MGGGRRHQLSLAGLFGSPTCATPVVAKPYAVTEVADRTHCLLAAFDRQGP